MTTVTLKNGTQLIHNLPAWAEYASGSIIIRHMPSQSTYAYSEAMQQHPIIIAVYAANEVLSVVMDTPTIILPENNLPTAV